MFKMSCCWVAMLGLGLGQMGFASGISLIGVYFSGESRSGGWSVSLDESEEAHGLYDSLQLTPDCGTTTGGDGGLVERCWKRLSLSNGFHLEGMKLTHHHENGHLQTLYSLSAGKETAASAPLRTLTFPLRDWINDEADQNKLIAALPDIGDGIDLLAGRFHIWCKQGEEPSGCFYDVNDLNYASVTRGNEKNKDEEKIQRGTPYSSVVMPSWSVKLMGKTADELYDALKVDGGQYQDKEVQLSADVKLSCNKRPHASDPYTVCYLSIADRSTAPFAFPGEVAIDYTDSNGTFPTDFSYTSRYGTLAVKCNRLLANQACKISARYGE